MPNKDRTAIEQTPNEIGGQFDWLPEGTTTQQLRNTMPPVPATISSAAG
jgi:hypothetical protein